MGLEERLKIPLRTFTVEELRSSSASVAYSSPTFRQIMKPYSLQQFLTANANPRYLTKTHCSDGNENLSTGARLLKAGPNSLRLFPQCLRWHRFPLPQLYSSLYRIHLRSRFVSARSFCECFYSRVFGSSGGSPTIISFNTHSLPQPQLVTMFLPGLFSKPLFSRTKIFLLVRHTQSYIQNRKSLTHCRVCRRGKSHANNGANTTPLIDDDEGDLGEIPVIILSTPSNCVSTKIDQALLVLSSASSKSLDTIASSSSTRERGNTNDSDKGDQHRTLRQDPLYTIVNIGVDRRLIVDRKQQLKMYRTGCGCRDSSALSLTPFAAGLQFKLDADNTEGFSGYRSTQDAPGCTASNHQTPSYKAYTNLVIWNYRWYLINIVHRALEVQLLIAIIGTTAPTAPEYELVTGGDITINDPRIKNLSLVCLRPLHRWKRGIHNQGFTTSSAIWTKWTQGKYALVLGGEGEGKNGEGLFWEASPVEPVRFRALMIFPCWSRNSEYFSQAFLLARFYTKMFSDFRRIAFLLALLEMSVLAFPLPSTSLDGNSKDSSSLGQRDGPAGISASTPPLPSTSDDDLGPDLFKHAAVPGTTNESMEPTQELQLVCIFWAKGTPGEHTYFAVGNTVLHAGWEDDVAGARPDETSPKPKRFEMSYSEMMKDRAEGLPIEIAKLGTGRFQNEQQAVADALAVGVERGQNCMDFVMKILEQWRDKKRVDEVVVEKFKSIRQERQRFFSNAVIKVLKAIEDGRVLSGNLYEWRKAFQIPPGFTKEDAAEALRKEEARRART
ncbi:hypothetical protein EV360DRAFT_72031 [Lentinula raphanica]|nr:hypothetical protein EV360DRAFT_72031 [Lentinula raphanica]